MERTIPNSNYPLCKVDTDISIKQAKTAIFISIRFVSLTGIAQKSIYKYVITANFIYLLLQVSYYID